MGYGFPDAILKRLQECVNKKKHHAADMEMKSEDLSYESILARFLLRCNISLHDNFIQIKIVLIDEYDAPLNHAFRQGLHEEASSFF